MLEATIARIVEDLLGSNNGKTNDRVAPVKIKNFDVREEQPARPASSLSLRLQSTVDLINSVPIQLSSVQMIAENNLNRNEMNPTCSGSRAFVTLTSSKTKKIRA